MQRSFQVWFYIGAVLSLYGVMLTAAGVYQWIHIPPTVLAGTHSTFWAGAFLLLVGGAYTTIYWPHKVSSDSQNSPLRNRLKQKAVPRNQSRR
jgi:energy-converting hydrogenase Eha subunit E